MHTYSFFHRN